MSVAVLCRFGFRTRVTGKDAFHRVPIIGEKIRDAVERVLTSFWFLFFGWGDWPCTGSDGLFGFG